MTRRDPSTDFGLAMSNPGAAVEVATLSGAGIGAPLPSANERVNSSVWFHALRAGPAETLTAGSAHVALPFDVVTDAEWSLSVAASPLPDASLLEVEGTAALLNGGPVGVAGVPCRLTEVSTAPARRREQLHLRHPEPAGKSVHGARNQ